MPDLAANTLEPVGGFKIKNMMMRYNLFMPRLYNWCKSLGFDAGKIMPSRAFCSDESQGYPIIMIAKHFGTFPFNHGQVGGVVATDRHGPHATHGQDLVIIQASHVGYEPQSKQFGVYRRLQTTGQECSSNCGKVADVIAWYQTEYRFAQQNIMLQTFKGQYCITLDNQLLNNQRDEGLLLFLDKLIKSDSDGQRLPLNILSTSKVFAVSDTLLNKVGPSAFEGPTPQIIGDKLTADFFYFKHKISKIEENIHHLEHNLIRYMPQIITNHSPHLIAAQINTQIEFDRTFRTIIKNDDYHGKKVLFIAGLNIDISPAADQLFPLTKFVPWAAYLQNSDGTHSMFEQQELVQLLEQQSTENPDQINLEDAIHAMTEADEVKIEL